MKQVCGAHGTVEVGRLLFSAILCLHGRFVATGIIWDLSRDLLFCLVDARGASYDAMHDESSSGAIRTVNSTRAGQRDAGARSRAAPERGGRAGRAWGIGGKRMRRGSNA